MFRSLWKKWFQRSQRNGAQVKTPHRATSWRQRAMLAVERLEDRLAPADLAITSVNLTPTLLNENDVVTIAGTFHDNGTPAPHTVVISWGGSEGSTTIGVAAGVGAFSADHRYHDDGGLPGLGRFATNVSVTNDVTGEQVQLTTPTGIAGWWTGDGHRLDSTTFGNHPYPFSTATPMLGEQTFAPGVVGAAFVLNGQTVYEIPNPAPLFPGSTGLSIAAWVNPNSHGTIFSDEVPFFREGSQYLATTAFFLKSSAGAQGLDFPALALNEWSHLVATWDRSAMRVYVNGAEVASRSAPNAPTFTGLPFVIGGERSLEGGNHYAAGMRGLLDELQYYQRSLGAAEIQAMYTAGAAGQAKPVLVANVAPANVDLNVISTEALTGGTRATVAGRATDPGHESHRVIIDWEHFQRTTLNLEPDQRTFTASHVYLHDPHAPPATHRITATVDDFEEASDEMTGWWTGEGTATDIVTGWQGALQGNTTYGAGVVGQAFSFPDEGRVFPGYDNVTFAISIDPLTGVATFAPDNQTFPPRDSAVHNEITLPNDGYLNPSIGDSGMSISAWVNPSSIAALPNREDAVGVIWTNRDSSLGSAELRAYGSQYLSTSEFILVAGGAGNHIQRVSYGPLPVDTWSHVAAVWDHNYLYVYVNGVEVAREIAPFLPYFHRSPVTIGGREPANDWLVNNEGENVERVRRFAGSIDELQWNDRPLTAEEVRFIYNAGSNGAPRSFADVTLNNVVPDTPPTLAISGAALVDEGTEYTLDLSASDPDGLTIDHWTITWGDGDVETVPGNPASATHTYDDGTSAYTISATATDATGTYAAGSAVALTIDNVAPSLGISGDASVNEDSLYTLGLSSSDPGADTIDHWTINWGDGTIEDVPGNPAFATHTYADGTILRTISATATDEDGTFAAGNTLEVLVEDIDPTLPVDIDDIVNSVAEGVANGTPVGITAHATDVAADAVTYALLDDAGGRFTIDPVTGAISVADGSLLNYETATSHDVIVKAMDEDGGHATATFTITVVNRDPTTPVDGDAAVNELSVGSPNTTPAGITAFATDPNGPAVTYGLTDNAGGRFAIDPSTGVVTVADAGLLVANTLYTITVQASDGAGGAATATFNIRVRPLVSAQALINDFVNDILVLRQQGVLNNGQANSLIVKLNAAKKCLDKGDRPASVNQVEAFKNEVSALRDSGRLTGLQADELLGLADNIIRAILAGQ